MNNFIVKPNKSVKEIIDSNDWRATEKRVESAREEERRKRKIEQEYRRRSAYQTSIALNSVSGGCI